MDIKNILSNIKKKTGKNKRYDKVFMLEKDEYRSAKDWSVVDRITANKGIVVQKVETSAVNFLKKEKKVYGMPFVYKSKNKKEYFMSAKLTTNYMKAVLQDRYTESRFVITFPTFVIAFFGNQIPKVIKTKDSKQEEIKSRIEAIYQGLGYVELDFFDFLKLVKKEPPKIQFILLVLLIPFAWYIYNTYEEQQQDSEKLMQQANIQQVKKPKKKKIEDENLKRIMITNDFIKFIYDINLKNGSFIGDIDIQNKAITLYSFAPMPNSFYGGNFFKKIIYFTPKSEYMEGSYSLKSPKRCMNILGEVQKNTELISIRNSKITFRLNKQNMNTNKLDMLLKGLYGCPIIIRNGSISYSNLKQRNVMLSIELI